jgi:hypothetical protein
MVSILISTLGQQAKPGPYAEAFSCKPGRCLPLLTPLPVQCLWWYHALRCFGLAQWANPGQKTAQYANRQPGLAKTLHRHCGRIIQVENLGYDHAIRYYDGSLDKPLPCLADMLASQTSGSKRWPLMSEPSPSPTTWPLMAIMPRASARSTWRRSVTRGPI